MKYLILIIILITLASCGASNSGNNGSASSALMTQNNFKAINSIPTSLVGTWAGYEANGTPIEITIITAAKVSVKRFSDVKAEQVASDASNYLVITDSKNNSYWHISAAGSYYLNLVSSDNKHLNLTK